MNTSGVYESADICGSTVKFVHVRVETVGNEVIERSSVELVVQCRSDVCSRRELQNHALQRNVVILVAAEIERRNNLEFLSGIGFLSRRDNLVTGNPRTVYVACNVIESRTVVTGNQSGNSAVFRIGVVPAFGYETGRL